MKFYTYGINRAIEDVANAMRDSSDHAPTTIRCALNDALDSADKDGYQVNFEYDQSRAVKRVQSILNKLTLGL